MKILLTGASGYVGSCIAFELNNRGIIWRPLRSRLQDLQLDEIVGLNTVIHCAAEHRNHLGLPDSLFWETNFKGTENLLKKCKEAGVKRFIFISTIVANDSGAYSESKLAAENILKQYNFEYIILRPCQLLGSHEKFFNQFTELKKLNWRYRVVVGRGDNKIFPTAYVKDFAVACVDAAISSHSGQTYNFLGEAITEIQYLRAVRKALNIKFIIIPLPKFIVKNRIGQDRLNKWQEEYIFEKCDNWKYQPTPIEEVIKDSYWDFLKKPVEIFL